MMALRMVSMALVVGLLGGCATTKPEMSSENYVRYSKSWVVLHNCNKQGDLDSDTAATGLRYIQSAMNSYTFNPGNMDENIRWTAGKSLSSSLSECRELAMQIHQRKQQIQINNANVEAEQQAIRDINTNRPKQTYCNKIGNQTFCNTY